MSAPAETKTAAAKLNSGALSGTVVIELSAVIVGMDGDSPRILLVRDQEGNDGLPSGAFDPTGHRTLEEGLRTWVDQQTGLPLGYVEQLYTFGDRFRDPQERAGGPRPVSVGYLALLRKTEGKSLGEGAWSDWYRSFPWEDWRAGTPEIIDAVIAPGLLQWCERATSTAERERRQERASLTFALGDSSWDNERVLERYELLYEAGLVPETARDGLAAARARDSRPAAMGVSLIKDHRRILATAIGRLRAKIKYRPVIFELMPLSFTLHQLQKAVEALAGGRLHKQNFRRLVTHEGLVERTGQISAQTGGRPAELFRFSAGVVLKRPAAGVRLPVRLNPRRKGAKKQL